MLKTFLLGLAVAGGFMLVSAPGAEAGTACDRFNFCGIIINHNSSTCRLKISDNWNPTLNRISGRIHYADPGQEGKWKDDDGFAPVSGCKYRIWQGSTGWSSWRTKHQKVSDGNMVTVQTVRK